MVTCAFGNPETIISYMVFIDIFVIVEISMIVKIGVTFIYIKIAWLQVAKAHFFTIRIESAGMEAKLAAIC
jgi:hypothetical protein